MSLTLIAPPADEPVTLAEFKEHIKIDGAAEDAALLGFLLAARRTIEGRYNVAMLAQGWRLALAGVGGTISLPLSPVLSVDSVGVVRGGVTETLPPSAYEAQAASVGRVRLKSAYPDAGVVIAFTAGWASVGDVPEELKLGVKMLAARFYERREGEAGGDIPGVVRLLSAYRRVRL